MHCAVCGIHFNDGVQCNACKSHLDFGCAQVSETTWRKMGIDKRTAWKCSSCRTASPSPAPSSDPASLADVLAEIRVVKRQLIALPGLVEDVRTIKDEMQDLKSSFEFMGTRLDNFSVKLTEVENKVSMLEDVQEIIGNLEKDVLSLKAQLSVSDQRSRLNNVEIKGVPLKKDENLFSIIDAISKKINYTVPKAQINYLYRVPLHGSKDKALVVSFTNRYTKEEFMAAARASKGLAAPDIGFRDSVRRIYINDHLNAEYKTLLNKAKLLAKEKGYNYIWVKFGKIHVRKNDTSPVFTVSQESDLNKIS